MIPRVTSFKMSRYGIMATQLLATLTIVYHLLKSGIIVHLVNLRHPFLSTPLDVYLVSQPERWFYVLFRELILSCSILEEIDPSRVSFFPPYHVDRISQSKTSRQWWWSNQRSLKCNLDGEDCTSLRFPFILPYAWISRRDSCLVGVSCHIPSFWHCTRLTSCVHHV